MLKKDQAKTVFKKTISNKFLKTKNVKYFNKMIIQSLKNDLSYQRCKQVDHDIAAFVSQTYKQTTYISTSINGTNSMSVFSNKKKRKKS